MSLKEYGTTLVCGYAKKFTVIPLLLLETMVFYLMILPTKAHFYSIMQYEQHSILFYKTSQVYGGKRLWSKSMEL